MPLFRGTQKGSVDQKWRLKLPAFVKRRMDDQYRTMDVFVTSLDGVRVRVYPISEWERAEAVLSERSAGRPGDGARKGKLLRAANHYGSEEKVDRQGRLLIPGAMRSGSDLQGPVKIQWQAGHMVVMTEPVYAADLEANMPTAADLEFAADLGL